MGKMIQIEEKKFKQQKNCQKFEIKNLKRKGFLFMNKNFKIILMIPTLNKNQIPKSNLFEIF